MKEKLAIIMPVYNEEEAIGNVLEKWIKMLDTLHVEYHIHAYNDGSKDKSLQVLTEFAKRYPQIHVHDKKNSGHGPTILQGYCENQNTYTWLFQMDSDDEMGPESFPALWERREQYDFLIGIRDGRQQPFSRRIVSFGSRLCIHALFGRAIWDVNCPYRLMRSEKLIPIWQRIPSDTFVTNLLVSGMVARSKLRVFECPVSHENRKTGTVSIKKWKLFKAAVRSFRQTILFALTSR